MAFHKIIIEGHRPERYETYRCIAEDYFLSKIVNTYKFVMVILALHNGALQIN